jgi:D-glycero-alpha-D-manno-heptose-7-phosphate kinase
MNELREELIKANRGLGLKICGAGGGGCFIITHPEGEKDFVSSIISKFEMKKLDFFVEAPIE